MAPIMLQQEKNRFLLLSVYNKKTMQLFFSILFLLITFSQAQAACDISISSVPQNLTQAGKTYCLTGDITSGSGALAIKASNITIDGQGHSIKVSSDIANPTGNAGAVIKNIHLQDGGINFAYGTATSTGVTITDSTFDSVEIYGYPQITFLRNVVNGVSAFADNESLSEANRYTSNHDIEDNLFRNDTNSDDSSCPSSANSKTRILKDVRFVKFRYWKNSVFSNNIIKLCYGSGNIVQMHYSNHVEFSKNTIRVVYPDVPLPAGSTADERYGVHIRDRSHHNTFDQNVIYSNGVEAMLFNGPGNATVDPDTGLTWGHHNTVTNNQIFLLANDFSSSSGYANRSALRMMTTSGDDHFENNLIYAEKAETAALLIDGGDSGTTSYFEHNSVISKDSPAVSTSNGNGHYFFRNNIFYTQGAAVATYSASTLFDSAYNLYFSSTASAPIKVGSSFKTLKSHQLASGQENSSIQKDPLFSDFDALNFHLESASPAINAANDGKDLGVNFDSLANPQGATTVSGGCATGSTMNWGILFFIFAIALNYCFLRYRTSSSTT